MTLRNDIGLNISENCIENDAIYSNMKRDEQLFLTTFLKYDPVYC